MTATELPQTNATIDQSAPTLPVPAPEVAAFRSRANILEVATGAALPIAVVLLALLFYSNAPVFLTWDNWVSISVQIAALMTISIPFAMLLMAGKVDLSVGSLMGLCGVVAGSSFETLGTAGAVALSLAIGITAGLGNGILVVGLGMSPIIVTLGSLTLLRGIAQWIGPDPIFGFPDAFTILGHGEAFGLPYLTWILLAVVALAVLAMQRLPLGRHIVAIGVNERAAYLVGVPVRRTGILLYVLVGFAAAVAGLMTVARINSAPSGTLGIGVELNVLTAVLLGGVPFTGGKGSIMRVALGVWLLGMLSNGLILMNVQTEKSLVITGGVLIVAAGLDVLRKSLSR